MSRVAAPLPERAYLIDHIQSGSQSRRKQRARMGHQLVNPSALTSKERGSGGVILGTISRNRLGCGSPSHVLTLTVNQSRAADAGTRSEFCFCCEDSANGEGLFSLPFSGAARVPYLLSAVYGVMATPEATERDPIHHRTEHDDGIGLQSENCDGWCCG